MQTNITFTKNVSSSADRLIAAIMGLDTRLLEFYFAGMCALNGLTILTSDHPKELVPYLAALIKWVGRGEIVGVHWGMAMLLIGAISGWNVVLGLLQNNHYAARSLWICLASAAWTIIAIALITQHGELFLVLRYSWTASICWAVSLLLFLKLEAVKRGAISCEGTLSNNLPLKTHRSKVASNSCPPQSL